MFVCLYIVCLFVQALCVASYSEALLFIQKCNIKKPVKTPPFGFDLSTFEYHDANAIHEAHSCSFMPVAFSL